MNETQKRIKAYQAMLPGLKERVLAVALLLVVSLTMMTSATFAWLTISRAPELTGVSTTVAANGNLEIALVSPDGARPGESQVGDSSAAEGQSVTAANLTWGNLVNLSDPSYGLDNVALRPALLSDYNLNKYPLYGATYGQDGRVISTSDRYEFATWTEASDGTKYFAAGDASTYGVRAIASVKYENITGNAIVTEMWVKIDDAYGKAKEAYFNLVEGVTTVDDKGTVSCIDALSGMIQIFAQEKIDNMLDTSDTVHYSDYSEYVTYFYRMMEIFMDILDLEGEALLNLANLQAYLHNSDVGSEAYKTLDQLLNASTAELERYGVKLESLTSYKTNRTTLQNDLDGNMKTLAEQCDPSKSTSPPEVRWSQIQSVVNDLVNINTTTLEGMAIGSMGGKDLSTLVNIALSSSTKSVVIQAGILKDTEQRLGARMADKNVVVSVRVSVGFNKTVKARVTTTVEPEYASVIDRVATENMNDGSTQGGDAIAKDTYGMAVDLWVRTNARDVILALEGSTLYETVPATCVNKNGVETELFTLTEEDIEVDVYQMDGVWYYADSHEAVDETLLEGVTPTAKTVDVVVGYQGENRIWENWEDMLAAGLIEEDSTTQGTGSCYVFYADNPSDQTRVLDLLRAFTIAFVNEDGDRLATAVLDIDRAYAINGKVTVPLMLTNGVEYEDEDGQDAVGITALNQNEPTRITAIIYLNGMRLENENVLSAGEIQGRLNLQFGSSISLTNPNNEELQAQYRTISAVATYGDQTSSNEDTPITFSYDGTAKAVTVNLTVAGEQPENVSGFFVRKINATQGTRGDSVDFVKNDDGTWSATFDLKTPGDYVFRSLIVDGVEYTLEDCPAVDISGLTISYISTSHRDGIHMTADDRLEVMVTAKIDTTPELMPSQVRAQFRSTGTDGKEFNAIMTYDAMNEEWVGTATINSSGTYTLEYLVMDGEYTELSAEDQTTLIVYLGMTSGVWTSFDANPNTDGQQLSFEFTEPVTIPVQAKVWDDTGAEMKALTGVNLYYHVAGSSLDQNGMHAALTWNADTGYYEGEFNMTVAGIYSFDRLQVASTDGESSSTIRKASNAPEFTAIPPEPPEYYADVDGQEYQFAPNSSANLQVKLAYANSAVVWAELKNLTENTSQLVKGSIVTGSSGSIIVDGKEVQIGTFRFDIPGGVGSQDGEWQLTTLYFQQVFANGKMYPATEGEPTAETAYVMDVTEKGTHAEHGIYTYVVSTVNIKITQGSSAVDYTGMAFGGTMENPTGYFMDSYTEGGITVVVEDFNHRAIGNKDLGVTVTWSMYYDGDSVKYGGYSGVSPGDLDELTGVADTAGTKFEFAGRAFQYAGKYTSKINVKVGDTTYPVTGPEYTVSSIKPYVMFTATTPAANESFTGFNDNLSDSETRTNTISADGFEVTCFFRNSTDGGCSQQTRATPSEATTGLFNAGKNYTRATCVIDGTEFDVTYTYSPTADGTPAYNTQAFGSSSGSGQNISTTVVGIGRQAKTLILEYGGNSYTVTLSTPLTANAEY